jgi:type III pantothenate kinase
MNLLIDMGNSRLKWGITSGGQIIAGPPLDNNRVNRDELTEIWKDIHPPRRLAISCVSADPMLELVQTVALDLWLDIDIILVKSQAQAFGVINAYQLPEQLGVDRWLSLVAAWQQYLGPICIADCGTAITVDLINADGRHQGGLICPGLTLMKKSLGQGTAGLSFNESVHIPGRIDALDNGAMHYPDSFSHAVAPANHTEAAIYNGTLAAAIGLIEYVLAKQPGNCQLILTGGDAGLIAGQLAVASIVEPDLVLRGLLCVLEGHT